MLTTTRIDELSARAGTELGVSEYVFISQKTVDGFADVTGDLEGLASPVVRRPSSARAITISRCRITTSRRDSAADRARG